jgi:hypothetical protein
MVAVAVVGAVWVANSLHGTAPKGHQPAVEASAPALPSAATASRNFDKAGVSIPGCSLQTGPEQLALRAAVGALGGRLPYRGTYSRASL